MKNIRAAVDNLGIKPASIDKFGPKYLKSQIDDLCLRETIIGTHVPRREKAMSNEINEASNSIQEATAKFKSVFEKMIDIEQKASFETKKVSGNIRKAADDLASGLLKVQKTADFAQLERHVLLLERAASALTALSELDKSGRLEKLIKSMK